MIGVFKKKTELPEYLSHYGMHRAPFAASLEDDMYYADPVRQQRLDILLHLAQNTNELLVVIGEEGMGKSTFLNQFRKNAADHWKLCFVEGHKMMTEEQFLQRVYLGFGIAHASVHKGTMIANLRKRLGTMLQEAIPVILVIDNAHLFSTKVLALTLEIASIKNTKSGSSVRVVLSSEPQIKILLAEPSLDETHSLIVRKIDLPPLNEEHAGNYLRHRLSQAGMLVEQFLTQPTIRKIFKKSGGVPKKINEAADTLLFETTPIIRRDSHIQSKDDPSGTKYILLTIIISLITGVAVYQYITNYRNSEHPTSDRHVEETATPLQLPPLNASPDFPAASTSSGDEPADPMQSLKEQLMEYSTTKEKNNLTKDSSPKVTLPQLNQPQKLAISEDKPKAGTQQNATSKQALKDNAWMLAQKPEHFTIQLVAGRQKETITKFIKKYKLTGDQLIYFSSQRNGKVWHNLAYGVYVDRKSVNNASKKLPSTLAKLRPWIRQIKSVQSEIKKLS